MQKEPRHLSKIRFAIAREDIQDFFAEISQKTLSPSDFYSILSDNRRFWRLSDDTSVRQFINWLLEDSLLREHVFAFSSRTYIRYTWGDLPLYPIVLSLKPNSFFSHYTAVYLHDLTDQIPKTIYLNSEQPPKPKNLTPLVQDSVDRAFRANMRKSKAIAPYGDYKICLLNGMHTGQLGVTEMKFQKSFLLPVTNIERTLIDITVRPSYSGGPHEVLEAYKKAFGQVSINKLLAILKKLNFKYPYHQAIGFYLEKCGIYKPSSISLVDSIPKPVDFFLDYSMKKTSYSKKWRLYYPSGF